MKSISIGLSLSRSVLILLALCSSSFILQAQSSSISINKNNNKTKMTVKNSAGNNFSMEYEGEVTLTDDNTDVLAISNNGYLEIRKSGFGSRRRIYMESNNGNLVKRYYVGAKETPFDPEGKKWLAEMLDEVTRNSTLGAENKVNSLYSRGGVDAVLAEVKTINSDYVMAYYIRLLMDKDLPDGDWPKVSSAIGDIDSDHHKADLLISKYDKFLNTSVGMDNFLKVAKSIDSDHHKANILGQVVDKDEISESQFKSIIRIVDDIDSDHHQANIINQLLRKKEMNGQNIDLILDLTENVDSDHHKANILQTALNLKNLSSSGYDRFINAIKSIDSDHHKANILNILSEKDLNKAQNTQLLSIVRTTVDSDHHKGSVIRSIIRENGTNTEVDALIAAIQSIDSDHHFTELLSDMSEFDLNDADLIKVLNSVEKVHSDHSKSSVLLAYAPKVKKANSSVKEAYRKVCETISSELDYGRALKAIK